MEKQIKKGEKVWWQPALEVFAKISGWIVFPLLLAIFTGNWLQNRYGHEPWIYIGFVATAFIISNVGLIKTAIKATKEIEKAAEINKEKEK